MTTGVTPNAANHAGLSALNSRFVETASLPWEATRFPGIEAKTLFLDKSRGLVTALMRMAPGSVLPDHQHVDVEQTYVIEGRLVDKEGPDAGRSVGPGEFVWRPAGSRHVAWAPEGGVMLGIFQLPNKFFEADGSVRDMRGELWDAMWRTAAE